MNRSKPSRDATASMPCPAGVRPLGVDVMDWRPMAPLPAELREAAMPPRADPAALLRSVTGAVVAVSAAMRHLTLALEAEPQNDAALGRAMAALNAAVADQTITARAVLKRLYDDTGV
jgi:hypothetical protein